MAAVGVTHFTSPRPFVQHLPVWLPGRLEIVYVTGAIEILLGAALLTFPRRRRYIGWAVAGFFVAVFPANIYAAVSGVEVDGLPPGALRWARLPLQIVLVAWALWATSEPEGPGAI